jgi:hypothetical protein
MSSRFYVIYVSPHGRPDFETGPEGPFTLEEATARAHPPDPLSGWRSLVVSEDGPAAEAELARVSEILREHGFEYPPGSRGVQDMAIRYAAQQEELHRLDPEHWAPMTSG